MSSAQPGPARPDPFVRAARFVGDFANPFYDEERQRDVWNEACAFGFQLALLTALAFATVSVWVVGRPALPWVQGGLLLAGIVSCAAIAYARRLGVNVLKPQRMMLSTRMIPILVLLTALLAGTSRATGELQDAWATAAGAVTGIALVTGLIAFVRRSDRRAAARWAQGD